MLVSGRVHRSEWCTILPQCRMLVESRSWAFPSKPVAREQMKHPVCCIVATQSAASIEPYPGTLPSRFPNLLRFLLDGLDH
ncbi:hypothetical protein SKAU_G00012020 [Synaphobranchus kaupii]|uniref:Uncharacterized protein n=1 Tax=Synaphobranchus kaupii TaxID=118154 RepID=A0A9Q1GBE9_SYNKA|nr:hypothetical protein SKAU_G00012020 [Synaphobranchus kaupii]